MLFKKKPKDNDNGWEKSPQRDVFKQKEKRLMKEWSTVKQGVAAGSGSQWHWRDSKWRAGRRPDSRHRPLLSCANTHTHMLSHYDPSAWFIGASNTYTKKYDSLSIVSVPLCIVYCLVGHFYFPASSQRLAVTLLALKMAFRLCISNNGLSLGACCI